MRPPSSTRRIRVLNVITRLERGGAPLALLDVLRRTHRCRFDVHLAAGTPEDPSLDIPAPPGGYPVPFHSVPLMRRSLHPGRDLASFLRLVRIIRRGRYHIVHTHTSKAGALGRLAAIVCRVPAIVHSPHGTVLEGYFGRAAAGFYATVERLVALRTDCIVSLTSREVGQYLAARIGRPRQHRVIANGIDIGAFDDRLARGGSVRAAWDLGPDHVVCVTVGRLVPVKGHADLLEAFAIAHARDPRLRLLVVGEGELGPSLRARAALPDLEDCVVFTGWRDDVAAILGSSDLFVLASLNEGLGLVLVEAMAAGLPVVATAVGGVPHVVQDGVTGRLVGARDPAALAAAILCFSGDPALRRSAGAAGRQRAVRSFSVACTVQATEALYEALLADRR